MRPDEEGALLKEREVGEQARNLLEGTYFKKVFEKIRDDCHHKFASSAIDDDDTRRTARLQLDALEKLVGIITHDVQTGDMAHQQLEKREADKKKGRLRAV